MEIGRMCVKIAGRDAGLRCVIIDILDKNRVFVDGETRRRNCNAAHLEPLHQKIEIEKKASHEAVIAAFKELGIEIKMKKSKSPAPAQKSAPAQTISAKPNTAKKTTSA